MKAEASVSIEFKSEKFLETVFKALKPETLSPPTRRSKTSVTVEGKTLTLKFEAKNTTALRAALNSYLMWVKLTVEILEFLENT
jgi:tRNA threonylcarbamoyladenosine modification (KEOPS) complex  Pcc1 subunit